MSKHFLFASLVKHRTVQPRAIPPLGWGCSFRVPTCWGPPPAGAPHLLGPPPAGAAVGPGLRFPVTLRVGRGVRPVGGVTNCVEHTG